MVLCVLGASLRFDHSRYTVRYRFELFLGSLIYTAALRKPVLWKPTLRAVKPSLGGRDGNGALVAELAVSPLEANALPRILLASVFLPLWETV